MKAITLILAILLLTGCQKKQDDITKKTETASVQLPSMICGTCKKNIMKAVYRVDGVKEVDVNVDKKEAKVTFVSFQTNMQTIERAINDAGYDANETKRNSDAYEKLDACCKKDE